MSTDQSGAESTTVDGRRRTVLGMAAWSAGVALAGTGAARARATTGDATTGRAGGTMTRPGAASEAPTTTATAAAPPTTAPPAAAVAGLPAAPPPAGGGLLGGDAWVLHVARRASFGPRPALLEEIRAVGADAWLEQQLQPTAIDDREVESTRALLHDLDRGPAEFRRTRRVGNDVLADLRTAAVLRAVRSRRQLQEVMVEFWHDRLAVSALKPPVEWHLPRYDRDVIRPHALGRFRDLLQVATRSGAMLEYLDTTSSAAPDVNENHGRELLELHTVGRESGYGESDVVGLARVLSGWRVEPRQLEVVFDPERHHTGPATVLGWSTPGRTGDAAAADLGAVLDHLAGHPATARRIAAALVTRFVADDPPAGLVESAAATYLASGTDIAATLRHIFGSTEFRSGGAPIFRRPFDLLAALLRGVDATVDVPNATGRLVPIEQIADRLPAAVPMAAPVTDPLVGTVDLATDVLDPALAPVVEPHVPQRPVAVTITHVQRKLGQELFAPPDPSGHPLLGAPWSSGDALLRRWTLGAELATGALDGLAVGQEALADAIGPAGAAVDALARRCFGTLASPATRAGALAILGLGEDDALPDPAATTLLAFLLAAPEVQAR